MSTRRFSRLRLATALGPLLVVSAAWTASGSGPQPHSGPEVKDEATSPTNSQRTLPQAPLGKPASVTAPAAASQPAVNHTRRAATGSVSATGIPAAALAAYQRAATIIDDADPACHLDWPLLAGIGRVESDHGRTGGSRLTASGVASPAILGPTLTGKRHTSRILDTDRGRYDGDTRFDRALGPLQFLPSTWAIVGVDADGDGKRNPQDINDAALAAAVFLCSGSDLSDPAAQRAAVLRYNHSPSYAATVLRVAAAYRAGGVPAGTVTVQQIAALPPDTTDSARLPSPHQRGEHGKHDGRGHDGAEDHSHHQAHHQGSGVAAAAPQHPAQHAVADTSQDGSKGTDSSKGTGIALGPSKGSGTAPATLTQTELVSKCAAAIPTQFASDFKSRGVDLGDPSSGVRSVIADFGGQCADAVRKANPTITEAEATAAITAALDALADDFTQALITATTLSRDELADECANEIPTYFADKLAGVDPTVSGPVIDDFAGQCADTVLKDNPTITEAEATAAIKTALTALTDSFTAALDKAVDDSSGDSSGNGSGNGSGTPAGGSSAPAS